MSLPCVLNKHVSDIEDIVEMELKSVVVTKRANVRNMGKGEITLKKRQPWLSNIKDTLKHDGVKKTVSIQSYTYNFFLLHLKQTKTC